MRMKPIMLATTLALAALSSAAVPLQPGDPLVSQQWHLQNTGQDAFSQRGGVPGVDLNLSVTHQGGGYGSGVTIAVIDDGLEIAHPDLAANVVPGSKNFVTGTSDPTPLKPGDAHGTSVAGIAAAAGFNGVGVRGIAPAAGLQGFNWLKAQSTANWLHAHGKLPDGQPAVARVYNQSYGSSTMQSVPGNPDADTKLQLFEETYEEVSTLSHGGKGSLFVKSAGNAYLRFKIGDGEYILGHDGNNGLPIQDANLSTDNSNYWNLVVSALNADGVRSSYSSVGANVLLTTPGGEYGTDSPAMVTTDLTGCSRGYNTLTGTKTKLHGGTPLDPNCNYNSVMNGTSSAAPSATGSIALVMSANPALSARDVRHILVKTARRVDADNKGVTLSFADRKGRTQSYQAIPGWQRNAAGLWFHQYYGFGLVDVDRAVAMAQSYATPLPALQKTRWETVAVQQTIPDAELKGVESRYHYKDNFTVEAVQVLVNADHKRANDLAVELISPSGTRSVLLSPRTALINENKGLNQQRLLSNHFYGESAKGVWRLRVMDTNGGDYQYVYRKDGKDTVYTLASPDGEGRLNSWSIRFIGHRSVK